MMMFLTAIIITISNISLVGSDVHPTILFGRAVIVGSWGGRERLSSLLLLKSELSSK
jgi:hypothetical protein